MKTRNWRAIAFAAALLMSSPAAFAHGMGHGHHMMCASAHSLCQKDKALFGQMHQLHEKMHAVLTADKFDKKKFLALSSEMAQVHDKIMMHHAEVFAERASKMSAEERAHMVEGFHPQGHGPWQKHTGPRDSYSNLNK